jgi:hypothetical protein
MYYKNDDIYVGEWSDDKKHGKGLFIDNTNITIYYGNFVEGFQNGFGIFISKDQSVFIGLWTENKLTTNLMTIYNDMHITSTVPDKSDSLCSDNNDDKMQIINIIHENKRIILNKLESTIYFGKIVECKKDDVDGWEYDFFTSDLFVGKWNNNKKTDYGIDCSFRYDQTNKKKKYFVTETVESTKWANKKLNDKIMNKSPKIEDDLRIETLDGGKPKRKTRKQRKSRTRKNYRNRKNRKTKNNY